MNDCLLLHDWTKWEEHEEEGTETYIGLIYPKEVRGKTFPKTFCYQRRNCNRCGKVQKEEI